MSQLELEWITGRFYGFDLQYRRYGTTWIAPWRATVVVSKNERSQYRIETFGTTPSEAIDALVSEVRALDGQP